MRPRGLGDQEDQVVEFIALPCAFVLGFPKTNCGGLQ